MQPATAAVLLNRLLDSHRDRRRIVFLVGSGLTLPPAPGRPGVPGAGEIVRRVVERLEESGAELPAGVGNPAPIGYQEALELWRVHRGQRGLDELVREAVLEACTGGDPEMVAEARAGELDACRQLERVAAAWALPEGVAALGRLIADCPATFGTAVLTTNFDPLVEVAIRKAGGRSHTTFLAEDGRFSTQHGDGCHVIHVHGFWWGEGHTAHTVAQLTRPRPQLRRNLERFLEGSELVVLGYGGWRDVFSEVVVSILVDAAPRTEVLWCFYEASWSEIEKRYAENLERLAPGLDTVVVPYAGIDGNQLLPRLAEQLAPRGARAVEPVVAKASPFVAGPPIVTDAALFGRHQHRAQIVEAVKRCQPVQLLGERRMGKTSLLRWVERHVGELWPGWPVAWIDGGALADRSGMGLAMAIHERLGVIRPSLFPLVLLIDEAAALAAPGHDVDDVFFYLLRAAGQEQKLVWVSTSHTDLHGLFQDDHLTSPFLNDSLKIHVGALEAEAADALLAKGLEPDQARAALAEAGRLPYPLQWIADALFQRQEPTRAADAMREALEPAFDSWWRWRSSDEKRLLIACVGEVALAGLSDHDRRILRRLVARGLVLEDAGRFTLPGAAWRDFVVEHRDG